MPCSISTAAIGSRDSVQTKELRVFNDQFHVHLAALSHRRSHIKASQYHPKSSNTIRHSPPKRKKEDNPNIINIGVLYGVLLRKLPMSSTDTVFSFPAQQGTSLSSLEFLELIRPSPVSQDHTAQRVVPSAPPTGEFNWRRTVENSRLVGKLVLINFI